ncbi:MAG: SpoIID/LytB domain-containing protein [Bacteroidetes bacterium]|nr:SpoIID/LytB domain-containing protein [Bacteroidota bacterium]
MNTEPTIAVGILQFQSQIRGTIHGRVRFNNTVETSGIFHIICENGALSLSVESGKELLRSQFIECTSINNSPISFPSVIIGKQFHWEQTEPQTFHGSFRFIPDSPSTFAVINIIALEEYLESVVASEMNSTAPYEFLKAHAIISRSWLLSMLQKKTSRSSSPTTHSSPTVIRTKNMYIIERWYDREDHTLFDVCADDHCQRYHGITKDSTTSAAQAVRATKGIVLVHNNELCDTRFHKACGGRTDVYATAWDDICLPYLQSVPDSTENIPFLSSEHEAHRWISCQPHAFCNVQHEPLLQSLLPSFDQKTTHFYRWRVSYPRQQLEELIATKTSLEIGTLLDIVPLKRGPSGRLYQIKIIGTNATILVGKELEIRRLLSPTHLYSSAFIVDIERDASNIPRTITLRGGGWGHGVGLCQIGAAVMAERGHTAQSILEHYYKNTVLTQLY